MGASVSIARRPLFVRARVRVVALAEGMVGAGVGVEIILGEGGGKSW